MIKTIEEMQRHLTETYRNWWQEVSQIGFDDKKYSNPFYCGIPDNWVDSPIRIMICGEEGYGSWNKEVLKATDIIELQKHCLKYVNGTRENSNVFTNTRSAFWRRFKQIEFLQPNLKIRETKGKTASIPVIWTDCDKICAADCHNNGKNGQLSGPERITLHSVNTKILEKEVEILEPTHVVFLGWYTHSLTKNSLNYYSNKKESDDKYNYPLDIKTISVDERTIKLYYLYHPGLRNNRDKYSKDIEKTILDIKSDMNNIV